MLTSSPSRALLVLLSLLPCATLLATGYTDTAAAPNLQANYNTNTRPAPVWQKIGNTGLPTQNWWIQFDRAGDMYISSNNASAGGVSKSTRVTTPSSNNGGQINASVIANDGRTIVSATYAGIWLSTNNARSWFLAPGSPTGVAEGIETFKQPDGIIYVGFADGGVFYSHDNGYHWSRLGYPPGNVTNGDVWAMATASAGPYAGYLMVFAGNSGAVNKTGTGFWCYGPQAAPNGSWHFCGNNEFAGQFGVDVTSIVVNLSKTRAIAIHYGDRGTKPVYTDDGVNWNPCNSGLPPDASTIAGGANTQGMNIDPVTGYVYIVLKNGDVYRTTVPQ